MEIYRLIYHSCSAIPRADGIPYHALAELLEHCLDYNVSHRITGALAYHDGRFIQVIEGPQAAVNHLFSSISRDRRHRRIELVLHEPCAGRRFANSSMAFACHDPRLSSAFRHIASADGRPETTLSVVRTLAEIVT